MNTIQNKEIITRTNVILDVEELHSIIKETIIRYEMPFYVYQIAGHDKIELIVGHKENKDIITTIYDSEYAGGLTFTIIQFLDFAATCLTKSK